MMQIFGWICLGAIPFMVSMYTLLLVLADAVIPWVKTTWVDSVMYAILCVLSILLWAGWLYGSPFTIIKTSGIL
jgi:hypothetical protein